jgi:pilus assembly protein CpaC
MSYVQRKQDEAMTSRAAHRALRWAGAAAAFGAGCLWCLSAAAATPAAEPKADEGSSSSAAATPAAVPAQSADPSAPFVSEATAKTSQLKLLINKSVVLETRTPYKRVSVGQPEIADVNLLGTNRILVTGKHAGSTQLVVWDDGEKYQVVDVSVQVDVAGLQEQIKKLFPNVKVDVGANNGEVVMRGTVPSLEVEDQIIRVATPFGAKVQDFLVISGGQQVMLQVRFAEVSRAALTSLGVNLGTSDGKSFTASNIGSVAPFSTQQGPGGGSMLANSGPGAAVTVFGQAAAGNSTVQYFIDALRENSLLRILAEPNITAVSGQEASFLAGGAIPIPVSQGGTGSGAAISVDYREYGVKLKFVPVVLGNGKLRLKVSPEISDLDYANSVTAGGFKIPGITQRKVTTTVELADGQTFAIAGLLNTSVASSKDVTPLLGDLPVIGPAFRTVRFSRKETEMVVLVTPHLVDALNPADVPQLPGEQWRFPDEMELFFNMDLGGPKEPEHRPPTMPASGRRAPRYHGQFGFTPVEPPAGGNVPHAPMANTGKD